MIYPLFGSHNSATTPANTAVRYAPFYNGSVTQYTVESQACQIVSESMTLSNLNLTLQVAPGAGTSWDLTVMKNGVATAMAVTISGTNTTGSYTATTISFSAGDTISVRFTPTNTPSFSSGMAWNATAESTNQVLLGKSNATFTNVNNYIPISGTGGSGTSTTEAFVQIVVPSAGTFSNLYAAMSTAPGVGTSRIFTLYVNGVATTLTTTISDTATTNNDTSHSVSVAAGDTVSMNVNFTGVPASAYPQWGISFAPTTAGESFFGVQAFTLLNTTSTNYSLIPFKVGFATTDDFNLRMVVGAWRFKTIYMKTNTASGAGKSYTGLLRKNAADTALAVTATNTTTSQGASTNVDTAQGDLVNIAVTPNATPTASRATVSLTVVPIPITVTPGVKSLSISTFAPSINLAVTAGTASLLTSTFAPTVLVSDNKTIIPPTLSLVTSGFAPSVSVSDNQSVTPSSASLTINTFIPSVSASDHQTVSPGVLNLTLGTYSPIVSATANVIVVPDVEDLIISAFAPSADVSNNIRVIPNTASLITTTYNPTVTASVDTVVNPSTYHLLITTFAPTINHSVTARKYFIDTSGNIYWVINQELGLLEKV